MASDRRQTVVEDAAKWVHAGAGGGAVTVDQRERHDCVTAIDIQASTLQNARARVVSYRGKRDMY